jgi:hypothetical protein
VILRLNFHAVGCEPSERYTVPYIVPNLHGGHADIGPLNMELDLQSLFGLHMLSCTPVAETLQPPPPPCISRIWAHIRGRHWLAKIDNIFL